MRHMRAEDKLTTGVARQGAGMQGVTVSLCSYRFTPELSPRHLDLRNHFT